VIASQSFDSGPCNPLAGRPRNTPCRGPPQSPPPRVRDDGPTPLFLWGGMAKILEVIWGYGNQTIFSNGAGHPCQQTAPTGAKISPRHGRGKFPAVRSRKRAAAGPEHARVKRNSIFQRANLQRRHCGARLPFSDTATGRLRERPQGQLMGPRDRRNDSPCGWWQPARLRDSRRGHHAAPLHARPFGPMIRVSSGLEAGIHGFGASTPRITYSSHVDPPCIWWRCPWGR